MSTYSIKTLSQTSPDVSYVDRRSETGHLTAVAILNLTIKVISLGLALLPLLAPELPQFQDKWLAVRSFVYPLMVLAVPVFWWTRGRSSPYPHHLDTLVMLPFFLDMSANALNLYNTFEGTDKIAHWLISGIVVMAFGQVVSKLPISRLNAIGLLIGFGATVHTLWEIGEYAMMKLGAFGLNLTYENTIHDFIFGLLGTAMATVLTVTVLWPRPVSVDSLPMDLPLDFQHSCFDK